MTDKTFFSDDEWKLLAQTPLFVTMAVRRGGRARSHLGDQGGRGERQAPGATRVTVGPRPSSSPRSRTTPRATTPGTTPRSTGARRPPTPSTKRSTQLARAAAVLAKLPLDEAIEVRSWLLDLAHAVAEAAKGTNPKEAATIERIRVALGGPASGS